MVIEGILCQALLRAPMVAAGHDHGSARAPPRAIRNLVREDKIHPDLFRMQTGTGQTGHADLKPGLAAYFQKISLITLDMETLLAVHRMPDECAGHDQSRSINARSGNKARWWQNARETKLAGNAICRRD